ncbi:MAG: hypothetical protein CML68_11005 [Rhodobacteraceae bacterium]|nr:hypothetical protein [Paracoccaceae bacterium]
MTTDARTEATEDPTKIYDQDDPRYYGYTRFQFRLWHGMTTWAFIKMINGRFKYISPQRYGLFASVILVSLLHNFLAVCVKIFYTGRIKRTEFAGDPVCIIGFQRSGTTFLNELIACDDRFAYPDNLQCIMPETFILAERRLRRSNSIMKMEKRPMDDMDMSMDAPQEDEIALLNSGVPSPYSQIAFPSAGEFYHEALQEQQSDPEMRRKWVEAWVWFLRKVQFRNKGKRLLLKSPTHTVRVSLIRETFPAAKFIHITRNPYRIFHSNLKLGKALSVTQGFEAKGMTDEAMIEELIEGFPVFHEAYEEQKVDVPEGNLVTVAYEDLVKDPIAVIRRIYSELGLPDIEHAIPAMQAYVDSRKGYTPNKYKEDPEIVKMINDNWGIYFDAYGYDRLPVEGEEAPVNEAIVTADGEAPGTPEDEQADKQTGT